jgi:hypothetical protein
MPTDNESDLTLEPMDEPARRMPGQPALPLSKPSLEFGRPPDSTVRRSPRPKASLAAPVDEDRVGDYRHPDATRTNIPEAGVATQDRSVAERVTYAYDPHLDPQLIWAGKAEHTSFDVDTVSLRRTIWAGCCSRRGPADPAERAQSDRLLR